MTRAGDERPTERPRPAGPAAAPEDWRKLYAFGLPNGSVRALLALLVCGSTWGLLWIRPDQAVPDYLQNLMFIILGHYFAARGQSDAPGGSTGGVTAADHGPPPLYLPRGTVRWLLKYRVEDVLAAVVGFYFGSRS